MPLVIGAAAFLLLIVFLLVSSVAPHDMSTFAPSPIVENPETGVLATDTVTIDASASDRWQFFSFKRASALQVPDSAGWDLALQRFHVFVSGGAQDLGVRRFEDVTEVPESGYIETTFGRDTVSEALHHWYKYSFISHRLSPSGHVYAIRTRTGHYAKIEFLSYYCTGMAPGCVTFRYTYARGGGTEFR
ncbi:MAG: HmuY family protein [Gemmatimonadales bacterium]